MELQVVTTKDAERIFNWRNHPSIRQNSLNTEPLDFASHCQWLESVLQDPNRCLLFGLDDAIPIGVLRFDLAVHRADIHVYLDPEKTQKGMGTQLIQTGCKWLKQHYAHIQTIEAIILPENIASQKAFEKCGFQKADKTTSLYTLTL